jgi:16S rRNA G966 N2-methylase RsmD
MSNIIFTTSHKPDKFQIERALDLSKKYKGIYKNRRHLSKFLNNEEIGYFIVNKDNTLNWVMGDNTFFYHPSISKVKMKNIENENSKDYLHEAITPTEEDEILDLTLGLGSEALFLANFCKEVTATEGSFPIYLVVKESLNYYNFKEKWMKDASEKIKIINDNYKSFLRKQKDNSFDIVYCDPMFENPNYLSSSLNSLRKMAIYDKINMEDINHMLRTAKKKIVFKARKIDKIWAELKFDDYLGSRNSDIIFGVTYKK